MASSDSATRNSPNRSVNFMLHCTQTAGVVFIRYGGGTAWLRRLGMRQKFR
jgi:hypothetical protein